MLTSLSDRALVARAIEENAAQLLLTMGRAGGGEEYRDAHIHWTIGGSPIDYHNAVVHAQLTAETVHTAITGVVAKFREHNVPGSWHLTEAMMPPDLGERLSAHGFVNAGDEPGMAADLHALNENQAVPPALSIEQVKNEADLQAWARTLALGFGEGEREANWVRDVYRVIGLNDDSPFRHYLAWLNETPVGTASVFMDGDTAGIYFVMTAPEARRQGIGAAVTLAALRGARELGYRVGVLGSSEPGHPVYQRLGFADYCRMDIYEWHPPSYEDEGASGSGTAKGEGI